MSDNNINSEILIEYTDILIKKLRKVIRMKESGEVTLPKYLGSLYIEIYGNIFLYEKYDIDRKYFTIVGTVKYLSENESDFSTCKSEIFKCTNILEKLKGRM